MLLIGRRGTCWESPSHFKTAIIINILVELGRSRKERSYEAIFQIEQIREQIGISHSDSTPRIGARRRKVFRQVTQSLCVSATMYSAREIMIICAHENDTSVGTN
uniref:(northern house mosquito) hypothetical protein n=1 Tax=Culex pipiens TaxID=7175 RepID=A0A8D8AXG7_CULPI